MTSSYNDGNHMGFVDMHLTVSPHQLSFVSVSKADVLPNAASLIQLFFFSPQTDEQTRFFSYTETNDDEVSLVMDNDSLAIFESTFKSSVSGGTSVGSDRWRAIEIGEGEHEQEDSTGLASSVSGVLAHHGISIFYLSTYETDYVLVKHNDLSRVLKCLDDAFHCIDHHNDTHNDHQLSHDNNHSTIGMPMSSPLGGTIASLSSSGSSASLSLPPIAPAYFLGRPLPSSPHMTITDTKSALPISTTTTTTTSVAASTSISSSSSVVAASSSPPPVVPLGGKKVKLKTLSSPLYLHSIRTADISALTRTLIQLIFFPRGGSSVARLFSYSEIEDTVSLIVDMPSLTMLQGENKSGQRIDTETWRAIKVLGEWGFDETGLVYGISAPLTAAKISPFYFSTYKTDFVLVEQARLKESLALLGSKFELDTS